MKLRNLAQCAEILGTPDHRLGVKSPVGRDPSYVQSVVFERGNKAVNIDLYDHGDSVVVIFKGHDINVNNTAACIRAALPTDWYVCNMMRDGATGSYAYTLEKYNG